MTSLTFWNRWILVLFFTAFLGGGRDAFAQEEVAGRAPASKNKDSDSSDDDYDFSWLDPDKKVYVLQNRKFRKAFHPALYLSGAFNLSNPYRSGYGGVARASFWFTEQFGVEAFGSMFTYRDNDTLRALKVATSVLPYVREIRGYYGGVFAWAPFYGKLNIFNFILYYDWSINAGAGIISSANDTNRVSGNASTYATSSYGGIFFGTAQNFYISRHFAVRFDLVGMNYAASGGDGSSTRFTNFDFALGAGYIF